MDAARIQALIEAGLPGALVNVRGDDGVHFEADVISEQFAGKLPLARHRLVYATLGDLIEPTHRVVQPRLLGEREHV